MAIECMYREPLHARRPYWCLTCSDNGSLHTEKPAILRAFTTEAGVLSFGGKHYARVELSRNTAARMFFFAFASS